MYYTNGDGYYCWYRDMGQYKCLTGRDHVSDRWVSNDLFRLMEHLYDGECNSEACPARCDDSCLWSADGYCDDGTQYSATDWCTAGTDCTDCERH